MRSPTFISVDWGTTTLRCSLVASEGEILASREHGPGILSVETERFAQTLEQETAAWIDTYGSLPVLMSGMIGSRQGWVEVPYLTCPATTEDLARGLVKVGDPSFAPVYIVPGLAMLRAGEMPDVMRGEETQIIGALAASHQTEGLFVLPGTHSKWALVSSGSIASFKTFMTGEVFAALRQHTILARLMPGGESTFDASGFDRGVTAGAESGPPGALLHRLFSARTLGLFDLLPPAAIESYLSGVLIGAELAAAIQDAPGRSFVIIGSALLSSRYQRAAKHLQLVATTAPADCAALGHTVLANAVGLLKGPSR